MKRLVGLMLAAFLLAGCNKTMNLDGAFNATDGKIAGIVPDEAAAPLVAKAYKPAGDWLNQQADMARLYQSLPNGLALNYGIRHKGTKDGWIDLADYEQVYWFDPIITPLALAAPNFGSRIKPTPIVGTKPIPDSPTASAAPDSPPVGGGGVGDLLEPDVNSTLEAK